MMDSFFRSLFTMSKFSVQVLHTFPGVPRSLNYITMKIHLIITRLQSCSLQTFQFFYVTISYLEFLHGGYMVVRQGFFSFFNWSSRFLLKLWSAKLYSKMNMVFNTCLVLRSSSILHLAFRSAILSILSFEVVLCHSW